MLYKEYANKVLDELRHTLTAVDQESAKTFVDLVEEAEEVFCAGAGRSGFQVKGFAMRLMHMGISSYVVGETCTPNIKEGGLLVICSGFRVIIVTVANSLGNIRVFELLPKLKTKKYGWCIA